MSFSSKNNGGVDVVQHEIARALCHLKHGDWRYDPGRESHRKWFDRAGEFMAVCGIAAERREMSDGAMSIPRQATDRSSSKQVHMVGEWRPLR